MKRKLLTLLLLLVLFISGCEKKDTDAYKFKEEYEALNGTESYGFEVREVFIPDENPIVYKTADELVKAIEDKETFVVYFGFPGCPWCRSMIETFINKSIDNGIETVYYVDVQEIRNVITYDDKTKKFTTEKEGTESYNKLVTLLYDVLSPYEITDSKGELVETTEKRIYAPNVVIVNAGKPIAMQDCTADSLENPMDELTSSMKEEMEKEIDDLLNKFPGSGVCTKDKC